MHYEIAFNSYAGGGIFFHFHFSIRYKNEIEDNNKKYAFDSVIQFFTKSILLPIVFTEINRQREYPEFLDFGIKPKMKNPKPKFRKKSDLEALSSKLCQPT